MGSVANFLLDALISQLTKQLLSGSGGSKS